MFTPGYAAPEQLVGNKTGPWTDVHALGLVFTEMLTGQPPYGSDVEPAAILDPTRPTPRSWMSMPPWSLIVRS